MIKIGRSLIYVLYMDLRGPRRDLFHGQSVRGCVTWLTRRTAAFREYLAVCSTQH